MVFDYFKDKMAYAKDTIMDKTYSWIRNTLPVDQAQATMQDATGMMDIIKGGLDNRTLEQAVGIIGNITRQMNRHNYSKLINDALTTASRLSDLNNYIETAKLYLSNILMTYTTAAAGAGVAFATCLQAFQIMEEIAIITVTVHRLSQLLSSQIKSPISDQENMLDEYTSLIGVANPIT